MENIETYEYETKLMEDWGVSFDDDVERVLWLQVEVSSWTDGPCEVHGATWSKNRCTTDIVDFFLDDKDVSYTELLEYIDDETIQKIFQHYEDKASNEIN